MLRLLLCLLAGARHRQLLLLLLPGCRCQGFVCILGGRGCALGGWPGKPETAPATAIACAAGWGTGWWAAATELLNARVALRLRPLRCLWRCRQLICGSHGEQRRLCCAHCGLVPQLGAAVLAAQAAAGLRLHALQNGIHQQVLHAGKSCNSVGLCMEEGPGLMRVRVHAGVCQRAALVLAPPGTPLPRHTHLEALARCHRP